MLRIINTLLNAMKRHHTRRDMHQPHTLRKPAAGRRLLMLLLLPLLSAELTATAADYVFTYNGGYLSVSSSGQVEYTTTFGPSCVWTCVSSTSDLTAATLGTTSRYLYTTVDGTPYWLEGSTTDGKEVSVTTTAPSTAYWRTSGNGRIYIYRRNDNNYYLYYRGSSWRTSRSTGNGNDYYAGLGWGATDYRSTTSAVTTAAVPASVTYALSTPTVAPAGTTAISHEDSRAFTATATCTQTTVPAHTRYTIGSTNYYYYNGTMYTSAASFTTTDNALPVSYSWSLTGEAASYLAPTTGDGATIVLEYNDMTCTTADGTLTVTASNANAGSRTATVTVRATGVGTVATPTLNYNSATALATIATATAGATIHYTLDGSVPTEESTVYGAPFALTEEATVTAIALKAGMCPSATASMSLNQVATPTIRVNSDHTFTLGCATEGATIHYTTDGSEPTASSTAYDGTPVAVTSNTTVKAIGVKSGSVSSAVQSTTVMYNVPVPVASFAPSADGLTATVTLAAGTGSPAAATIHYTTDGSTPTAASATYSAPFVVSDGDEVRAVAVADGWLNSAVAHSAYEACHLGDPYINTHGGDYITFESDDEGVSFRYTYSTSGIPADPTPTSGTLWDGSSHITTIPQEAIVKVVAYKTGCVTSEVEGRTNNPVNLSPSNYVFMYNAGTAAEPEVHFLSNNGGLVGNSTTFDAAAVVWRAHPFSNQPLGYEPFVRFSNNGQYLRVCRGQEEDFNDYFSSDIAITDTPEDSLYFLYTPAASTGGKGSLINAVHYDIKSWTNERIISLVYNNDGNIHMGSTYFPGDGWGRVNAHQAYYSGGDYALAVTYPVEEVGEHDYAVSIATPAAYDNASPASVKKGESITFVGSTAGESFLPRHYRVGNEVEYYYFLDGGTAPLGGRGDAYAKQPTSVTSFNISYELLNHTDLLEQDGTTGTFTLLRDPGRDLLVTVRVKASPEGYPDVVRYTDVQFYVIAQPPYEAPVISRVEGANDYSITCSQATATIEYRIDGEAPCSAYGDAVSSHHSGWCIYTGPLTITKAGTVITARSLVYDAEEGKITSLSDPVEYTVGGAMLAAPTFSFGSGGAVTITSQNTAAFLGEGVKDTLYYTTNGSEPTTESSYVELTPGGSQTIGSSLANGQHIRAVSIVDGFLSSAVADGVYRVGSGVSGYVVTLDDYEDHNWSYYQPATALPDGYPEAMHSPYPRNVKITYYGNGEKNLSTNNTASPAASTFTENASGVQVGLSSEGETEHTFVYYKTLERDANNRFPYELIPNPFYVRPTSGSTYTGFYKWRVKSVTGGSIYSTSSGGTALATTSTTSADNVWLDAERTYYFQPTDSAMTNAQNAESMAVELEAMWASAVVSTSAPSSTYGVERVFYVVRGDQNNNLPTTNVPCTYTSFYPNGTTDGTTAATLNNRKSYGQTNNHRGNITASAATKVEYLNFNNDSATWTGNGNSLIIGRGVGTQYTYCSNVIYGFNSDEGTNSGNQAYTVRLESGIYKSLYLTGNSKASDRMVKFSGTLSVKCVLGSDYDRATGKNTLLTVAPSGSDGNILGGEVIQCSGSGNRNNLTFDWYVKSGTVHRGTLGAGDGGSESIYMGSSRYDSESSDLQYFGRRRLTVEGGEIASIAGGVDHTSGTYTSYNVNDGGWTAMIRIKGGTVRGSVYGAAAYSDAAGDRNFVFTGGKIQGWVAGGANGTRNSGGALYGNTYIYVGGEAEIGSSTGGNHVGGDSCSTDGSTFYGVNGADGGNVFGAGCGIKPTGYSESNPGNTLNSLTVGQVNTSHVAVADNATVWRDVYGGGNFGYVSTSTNTNSANVFIVGGEVKGNVFGGSNNQKGQVTNVTVAGGRVDKNVYGGSNSWGTIGGLATVKMTGGTIGTAAQANVADEEGNLFGGGYGTGTVMAGGTAVRISGGTVQSSAYGGGFSGYVGSSTTARNTDVAMSGGTVKGRLFGGGKGDEKNRDYACVYGNATVAMSGGAVRGSVYGGGELASVGTFSNYAANGQPANCKASTGITTVRVSGGTVGPEAEMSMPTSNGHVFGAGKGIVGDTTENSVISSLAYCDSACVEISGTAFVYGSVYGGSENGHVRSNTGVKVSGGQVGRPKGRTEAYTDAEWSSGAALAECPSWAYDPETNAPYDMYAYYTGVHDNDDLSSGSGVGTDGHTFYGNVFGGGSGYLPYAPGKWLWQAGRVGGNSRVEITGGHIITSVYGGNELTSVDGSCTVRMSAGTVGVPRSNPEAHPVTCNLYGAGKGDQRTNFNQWTNVASTSVKVSGTARVYGSVFGGGEDGHVLGDAVTEIDGENVIIGTNGGSVDGNVFGGGRGFSATALTAGVVCGNVDLTIKSGSIYGSVYGGGRLAAVGTPLVPKENVNYGIMQAGDGHGNIVVTISGGTIGNPAQMTIDSNAIQVHTLSIGDVYGGSKGVMLENASGTSQLLGLSKNTTVSISGSTTRIYGNVYGGGSIASVGDYAYDSDENVSEVRTAGTGKATVTITGGTIGLPLGTEGLPAGKTRYAGKTVYDRGHVYGGCLGMAGEDYQGFSYVTNAEVTVGGTAVVYGSVFGGGEDGHVLENTDVTIDGNCRIGTRLTLAERMLNSDMVGTRIFAGNVYGGGRGIDRIANSAGAGTTWHLSPTAGRVYGNTNVYIKGGTVRHNVYGGGSLASVGTFEEANEGTTEEPYWSHIYLQGTGTAKVTVGGGRIGPLDDDLFYDAADNYLLNADGTDYASGVTAAQKADVNKQFAYLGANEGEVYGSGRGLAITVAENEGEDAEAPKEEVSEMAFVRNTVVTIKNDDAAHPPLVCGSVFGGGENGHVKFDTEVKIQGGIIGGIPLHDAEAYDISLSEFSDKELKIGFNSGSGYDCREELGEESTGTGKTIYRGNVYGGGRGIDHVGAIESSEGWSASAGRVYGNAHLTITGGKIYHHVYGGGSIASVGNYVYDEDGKPTDLRAKEEVYEYTSQTAYNTWKGESTVPARDRNYGSDIAQYDTTGSVVVSVSGGQIGITGINEGRIYTSGRGIAGTSTSEITHLAFCNKTYLSVLDGADIRGSVFGGGANGHVLTDSRVSVTGGTIGWGIDGYSYNGSTKKWDGSTGHWSTTALAEAGSVYHPSFDKLPEDTITGYTATYGDNVLAANMATFLDFNNDGTGTVMYRGNVYGGGRGVDPNSNGSLSVTAGVVYGNSYTTVGGTAKVLHNVYGGGSMAMVGTFCRDDDDNIVPPFYKDGKLVPPGTEGAVLDQDFANKINSTGTATVLITGNAIIGYDGVNNNGQVYGSCRGMAYSTGQYAKMGYCRTTMVTIAGNAEVRGSVFGGGANGHVLQGANVVIEGGTVGVEIAGDDDRLNIRGNAANGKKIFYGNVYGGGRGIDTHNGQYSYTAGRVYGNTHVSIKGGIIYHNVYGGGSLASVGENRYIAKELGEEHDTVDADYTSNVMVYYGTKARKYLDEHGKYTLDEASAYDAVGRIMYENRNGGWFTTPDYYDVVGRLITTSDSNGNAFVSISGGQIGTTGNNNGSVFGSGRGMSGIVHDTAFVASTDGLASTEYRPATAAESKGDAEKAYILKKKEAGHTTEDSIITTDYSKYAFVVNSTVNIRSDADVRGSVFGSGENGHVYVDALVNMTSGTVGAELTYNDTPGNRTLEDATNQMYVSPNGTGAVIYRGNVYGGGRGVDLTGDGNVSLTAGAVYGNTTVNISGGTVRHAVYGGGSLASVGTYDRSVTPFTCTRGGTATVNIMTGAYIGNNSATAALKKRDGYNNGEVYGSGRGMAATSGNRMALAAYVNTAYVNIKGGTVCGAVFGGGSNGHVLGDTYVTMTGGTIGTKLSNTDTTIYVRNYTNTGDSAIQLETGEACTDENGYDKRVIYRGNLYGGGRGVDNKDANGKEVLSLSAGRVYGNTHVTVTGGTVIHNVYGGGSLASVGRTKYRDAEGNYTSYVKTPDDTVGRIEEGGTSTVVIGGASEESRAVIGVGGFSTVNRDGFNNGRVFGSGRGMANSDYLIRAYVKEANVTIEGYAKVSGAVFGSGENGHVQGNTVVTIKDNCAIGHDMTADIATINAMSADMKPIMLRRIAYVGNVYGAGRGIDESLTGIPYHAGYVRGNTEVNILGGTIYNSVYGGGSMAIVGDYGLKGDLDDWEGTTAWQSDPATAFETYGGKTVVNILSDVGTAANVAAGYGGNVFGSSRGRANTYSSTHTFDDYPLEDYSDMAYVVATEVNVGEESGSGNFTIWGSVYGGGENGHVDFGGTEVNILQGTVNGDVFGGGKGSASSPTAGIVDGNTQVNIGSADQESNTVVIKGSVFGGNDANSSALGTMQVDVYKTKHEGDNAYPTPAGASFTDEEKANLLKEAVAEQAKYYALTAVYGGGNKAYVLTGDAKTDAGDYYDVTFDTPTPATTSNYKYIRQRINNADWPVETVRKSVVNIHGCDNTVMYVYGGSNAADSRSTAVTIEGGRVFRAFAGGNGEGADNPGANVRAFYDGVTTPYKKGSTPMVNTPAFSDNGNVSINVKGGIVYQVFGGSNTKGVVEGTTSVALANEADSTCGLILNREAFGGGNLAPGGDIVLTLQCGNALKSFYAGGRNADVNGSITLNIEGGVYDSIFGGNKTGGIISGDVEVNYHSGSVTNLFGGCNEGGNILGTITVNVDVDPSITCADGNRVDYVYGGGKNASYTPTDAEAVTPMVNVKRGTVSEEAFGGGLGEDAVCTSNPKVTVGLETDGGSPAAIVGGNVFGGGNEAPVQGNTAVLIQHGTVQENVFGGGAGIAGSVTKGRVYKQAEVTLNNGADVKGHVFGGGNIAPTGPDAPGDALTTSVSIKGTAKVGLNVYGGGNMGPIYGSTKVTLDKTN